MAYFKNAAEIGYAPAYVGLIAARFGRSLASIKQLMADNPQFISDTDDIAQVIRFESMYLAQMYLQTGDWENADHRYETVLEKDPEYGQAYLGKLKAEIGIIEIDDLADARRFNKRPADHKNYKNALRFSTQEQREQLEKYDQDDTDCHMRHWTQICCTPNTQLSNDKIVYVADGIGDHYMIGQKGKTSCDCWEPSQPVVISAQTGNGKNYFIENVLLQHVRKLNHKNRTRHKILIISNRIALRLQTADRLNNKHINEDGEEIKIYSPNENVDVMSYQSFIKMLDVMRARQGKARGGIPLYLFVICDEAHYFTSDAMFNPYTDKALLHITRIFDNAIRIYMSATPYECLEHIMRHESSAVPEAVPSVFYHFARNYNYLNVKYYSEFEELKGIIENSGNENWLIFLDNKKKC